MGQYLPLVTLLVLAIIFAVPLLVWAPRRASSAPSTSTRSYQTSSWYIVAYRARWLR